MKRFLFLTTLCAAVVLLYSCQKNKTVPAEASADAEPETTVVEQPAPLVADPVLNSSARILAGLPLAEDDPLYAKTQTGEWKAYRTRLDELWDKCSQTLSRVSDLREKDLTDFTSRAETVLYAFSGPDFPFVAQFFPESENYVLLGLEPTGTTVDVASVTGSTYRQYETALLCLLRSSYFITKSMKEDLNNVEIDGTIPILTVLMARMGYDILSVDYQRLTEEGKWEDADGHTAFVRIRFFKPGATKAKTLYYLSTNIADPYFDPCVLKMLANLDPDRTASFVKSCSYCLHEEKFSKIREAILDHSFALVQDDTGITYKTLLDRNWGVTLYGTYVKPLSVFTDSVIQPDLDKAYKERTDIRPLDFRFGYNAKGSSLIVARRPLTQ